MNSIRQKRPRQIEDQKGVAKRNNHMDLKLSNHAQARAAQRCLAPADILYILQHGRRYHAADAIFYFLVGRDIPNQDRWQMDRLVGTAIIMDKERSTIITMWRNRQHGARKIRRKRARTR
jgi:hypothetical protein